ncbi:hypothetical protein BT69DRAFT_1346531 [Atractiella rhizophila]|nr:hypothetical protein BT69DRAFT_1346531 [Atractiella rhizophila]
MPSANKESIEMEVIGAGLGRTGTLSLFHALTILGYNCHHMETVARDSKRGKMLLSIAEHQNAGLGTADVDWKHVWKGYSAAVDSPMADWYHEAAQAFPNAKVILTTREPDAWWNSYYTTLLEPWLWNWAARLAMRWIPGIFWQSKLTDQLLIRWGKLYGSPIGPQTIVRHSEEVRKRIPKERLLEFNVKQGWEPLCKFLGKPIPPEPFPRANDGAGTRRILMIVKTFGLGMWALSFTGVGMAVWWTLKKINWIEGISSQ